MDPEAFSATIYKWDSRLPLPPMAVPPPALPPPPPPAFPPSYSIRPRELEDFLQPYGIRYPTVAKVAELGFTVSTLLDMTDQELEEMMVSLSQIFRWDLLVGERYGIRAAVRAERRLHHQHHRLDAISGNTLDALSQEGLSEELVLQQEEKEAAGSGGGGTSDLVIHKGKMKQKRARHWRKGTDNNDEDEGGSGDERQREHPFIVTEPGEVARGKKNGLDYLFHLYEECSQFLIQVQNMAKERGEKCPTKVTNQVFRYATAAGATYINKPKIRHYVHCYALHCLDEKQSNALRKSFKERGENVGAWRQACYEPLVKLAGGNGWDIDGIFSANPRLSIWYVPTKLRKLCHAQRSSVASATNSAPL